ncbi:MAG: GNAT family N-acetyltransferase [Candidatus Falkowbacteria bacterium]
MEIIKLSKNKYKEWDKFCLESDSAWFWHTTKWLNYTLNYRSELETKNLSFFVYKEGNIMAVVLLTIEKNKDNIYEFSFGGGYIPSPVLKNNLSNLEENLVRLFIFQEIDKMAREKNVARAIFKQLPISPSLLNKDINFNYLMQFGYIDSSLNTQIIDLRKSEEELSSDLRRNHKRNIKKAKDFKINFFTSKNITDNVFDNYKQMHHKASGRKTRTDITFEMMHKWIKEDLAFLVAIELNNKYIGFEYYSVYKNNVYGFSAANDPGFSHLPIRHFLEWESILWMKKQGYDFYEIGLQKYGALLYDFPDKKQLDISHFKKGFGGFVSPLFMGEKYYNKDFFLKVYNERVKKFAYSLNI